MSKLKIMKSAHQSKQFEMEDKLLKYFPEQIAQYQGFIRGLENDMKTLAEHPHPLVPRPSAPKETMQGFAGMVMQGQTFTEKEDAGKALLAAYTAGNIAETVEIGSYRGFTVATEVRRTLHRELVLKGEMTHRTDLGADPIGALIRIDNALDKMPERLMAVRSQLENLIEQRDAAKAEIGRPFPREDELKEKTARLEELDRLLNIDGRPRQSEQTVAKSVRPSVLDNLKRPLPSREKTHNKQKHSQQER